MEMQLIRVFLIILFLLPSLGYAGLYSWTDEDGVRHFSNSPPEKHTGTIQQSDEFVRPISKEIVPEKEEDRQKPSPKKIEQKDKIKAPPKKIEKKSKEVVMYTTPTCGYCHRAKAFFKKHGVRYTEYDIKASKTALEQYQRLNGRGVPLIFIGEKRISGFSKSILKKALDIR